MTLSSLGARILIFLLACADNGPRPLTISDASDAENGQLWSPEAASDQELAESESEAWNGGECSRLAEGGDDELETEWCVRLSPEGNETRPGSGSAAEPPPPCGFYNLLGATVLTGPVEAPVLLYCDSDQGGGIRIARYNQDEIAIDAEILAPENCWISRLTGAMIPTDGGWLAWWVGDAGTYATGAGVTGLRLDEGGEPLTATSSLPLKAAHLVAIDGDAPMLLGVDWDGTMWGTAVSVLDASEIGFPLTLGTGASSLGADRTEDGIGVAACLEEGGLNVLWLSSVGAILENITLKDAVCGTFSRPSVSAIGDVLAVSWADEKGLSTLTLLQDGAVFNEIELGELRVSPSVSAGESGWWVLDGTGVLSHYDLSGALTGSWLHPHFPEEDKRVMGMMLRQDGERFSSLLWERDIEFIGTHAYTFEFLELSIGWLPSR